MNELYIDHLKKKINELRKQCGELQYIIGQLNDRRKETICTAVAVGAVCMVVGVVAGYMVGGM